MALKSIDTDANECEQCVDAIVTGYRLIDTAASYMNEITLRQINRLLSYLDKIPPPATPIG